MKLFTRLSTSVTAAVDRAVSSIENHDAVLEAAIADIRRAVGQARAKHNRMVAESRKLQEQVTTAEEQAGHWARRAVQAGIEEDVALDCVRRKRDQEQRVSELRRQVEQHGTVQQHLAKNIQGMEAQLDELKRKRTVMRTREAAAEAQSVSASILGEGNGVDINDTLERWEAKIAAAEIDIPTVEDVDPLERCFAEQEEQASLEAELAAMRNAREG